APLRRGPRRVGRRRRGARGGAPGAALRSRRPRAGARRRAGGAGRADVGRRSRGASRSLPGARVIFGRRRFRDVIERQLRLFVDEHDELLRECEEALARYHAAERDSAEELYGDYVDLVETGTEALADMRDRFAQTLADVWRLFADGQLFRRIVAALAEPFADATKVAGLEARGFILGAAVATELGVGFVAIRKDSGLFPGPKAELRTAPDYRGVEGLL